MILGQLFHYNKLLDEVQTPLTAQNLASVKLFGLEQVDSREVENLNSFELANYIKNLFTARYQFVLRENKLNFATSFWQNLTSPLRTSLMEKPQTEYQNRLSDWAKNGFSLKEVKNLLDMGFLLNQEEDFALYYGLRVLQKINEVEEIETENLELTTFKDEDELDLSTNPEILVFADNILSPLFLNINCQFLPMHGDSRKMLGEINQVLQSNQDLKLVILQEKEGVEDMLNFLQKNTPPDILIITTDFSQNEQVNSQETYFDKLVRKTLGIRLN